MELKDVNLEELEKRYKRERNGKIKERLHYLLLLKEGYKDRDIEKIWDQFLLGHNIHYPTIHNKA